MANGNASKNGLSELLSLSAQNDAVLDLMKNGITVQQHLLDDLKENVDAWIARRKEGAEETAQVLQSINASDDLTAQSEAWQKWANGAAARFMADWRAQFETMSSLANDLSTMNTAMITRYAKPKAPKKSRNPSASE